MSDDMSPGEVGRTIARVEEDVREIKTDLKAAAAQYVTRAEYDVRLTALDREVVSLKQSLAAGLTEIKDEIKSSRPHWWVVAALVISSAAVVMPILTR